MLDWIFCAGSKNLFPDRFKKMLAQGYNTQTVSSVVVTGNQVVLTYGVNHGYVADRVLKLNAVNLTGEYVIDSVTSNTVTLTVDNAPTTITGGFHTFIASLGWQVVYEQDHIHIYKFKHIDGTDMFARFCFQNATASGRNCVVVGLGRSANLVTGIITDENCLTDLATCATVAGSSSNIRWDFSSSTARTFDNYTYNQGYPTFGKGSIVGSITHLIISYHLDSLSTGSYAVCSAILPFKSSYSVIDYPILLAQNNGATSATASSGQLLCSVGYIGLNRVTFHNSDRNVLMHSFSASSFLPANIDGFNTTTCTPLSVFTYTQRQFIGYCLGGAYQACYANSNTPAVGNPSSPSITKEIDFSHNVLTHYLRDAAGNFNVAWLAFPIEEIVYAS